ncbi:MAG: hypothetical protein K2W96_25195 [Gemmataceae bacterium]|nr:hypothetical protein [Gemmataceae bacterium]
MRSRWLGAALVLGLAAGAASAQSGWLPEWLGGKPAIKPGDKPDDRPDKSEQRRADAEALMNALLRRQAVCLKLEKIAELTGDAALAEEAKRLDDLAWSLYQQRSGRTLGAGSVGLDKPKIDDGLDETRGLVVEQYTKKRARPAQGGLR